MSTLNALALLPGRFKGITFLVSSETIKQIGQKWIRHDYPGTSIRYMEPHGKGPFEASMTITFSGPTYVSDFKNFKRVMEDPQPGTLYLPTLGVWTSVIAEQADASSDQSNLGEIPLTVNFTETVSQPSPQTADASQTDVFNQGTVSLNAIENSFANNYVTPATANSFQTALSDIQSIAALLQQTSGAISIGHNIANLLSQHITSPTGVASFLLDPIQGLIAQAGAALNGQSNGYISARALTTSGNTLSNTMQDINSGFVLKQTGAPAAITINTTINLWAGTTWEQQQRNNNRLCVVNSIRMAALVFMCEQAGLQIFTTAQQVQSVINDINNYFNLLVENDTTILIIQDVKPDMEVLKNNTISTLYQIEQQMSNVTAINVQLPISPRQLAYELYGEYMQNSDDLDTYTQILISLNKSQSTLLFSGQVNILEM